MALVRLQLALLNSLDDLGQGGVRWRGHTDLLALVNDEAIEELDLCAPALDHILTHRWPVRATAGLLRLGEAMRDIFGLGIEIAFACACNDLRIDVENLFELVAKRLADPDRLATEPRREMPQPVIQQYLTTDEAGAGRDSIPHGVDNELRPAFTPKILRHLRGVRECKQAANVPGTVGDKAVHLADAEHGVARAMLAASPADVTRLAKFDRDGARDRAARLPPADDAGDRLLIHAVLQRDNEAVGCEVLLDHRRRPSRVVELGADEGDLDR